MSSVYLHLANMYASEKDMRNMRNVDFHAGDLA